MAVTIDDKGSDFNRERELLYIQSTQKGYDLGTLSLSPQPTMTVFLSTRFNETQGRFSPDGRWIAYASDESGRFEVYVRPFPVAAGQMKISLIGGTQPEWRRDGRELFYISAEGKMMAVPLTMSVAGLEAGTPQVLFEVDVQEPNSPFPTDYTVTADGQRFLINTVVDQPTRPAMTVMLDWTDQLRR